MPFVPQNPKTQCKDKINCKINYMHLILDLLITFETRTISEEELEIRLIYYEYRCQYTFL